MHKNDLQYMEGFQDELKAFIGRVKDRAQARIDKAMKEYEEVKVNNTNGWVGNFWFLQRT